MLPRSAENASCATQPGPEWRLMAELIYITGVPGAGKSSLRRELRRRGHVAFGIDEDGLAAFYRQDGIEVAPDDVVDTAEWRQRHVWRIIPDRLVDVSRREGPDVIYVCGSAANEGEVWHLFALVIGLLIDDETLRVRLAGRVGNNFGKSADELALAIEWNRTYESESATWGVVPVDATNHVGGVADRVVALARALMIERRNGRD